ncbi:MAG: hypothetical protein JNK45_22750 [Myxococcales bacterium]|nr:hypothetical protein [Myxococcales bacterium]
MPRGTPPRRLWPWLVLGLSAACAKRAAAPDSEVPSTPSAADAAVAGSRTLESLEQDLGQLTGELELAETGEPADAGADPMGTASAKCERLCGIKGSICELSTAICELADDHTDEPRYAASCDDARGHCERATSVCEQRGCDGCPS